METIEFLKEFNDFCCLPSAGWLASWLAGWRWLSGWLAGWLAGNSWLASWLAPLPLHNCRRSAADLSVFLGGVMVQELMF